MSRRFFSFFVLLFACLGLASPALADMTISKDGIVITLSSRGMKITVDGLTFSRYSEFSVVAPDWSTLYFGYSQLAINSTDTVLSNNNSKMVTTLRGTTGQFTGTQTIEILDGRKIKMTMTGKQTTGANATMQLIQLSVEPEWFAGCSYTMVPNSGSTKTGTVSAQPTGSNVLLFSNIKNLTVNSPLGAVGMAWTGPSASLRDYRVNDWNSSDMQFIAGPISYTLANNTTFTGTLDITLPTITKPSLSGTLNVNPVQQSQVMSEHIVKRIVPTPKSVTWGTGELPLVATMTIGVQAPSGNEDFMNGLRTLLKDKTYRKVGISLGNTDTASQADVLLSLKPSLTNQKLEQYSVRVTPWTAVLEAQTTAGLVNAVQTYEQLLIPAHRALHCADVSDWPSMSMRAIHFFTGKGTGARDLQVSMLRNILGALKVNTLLYECEYINWTCDSKLNYAPWGMDISLVRDVIAEAARQYVEIVPLVNSFGHCEWFLRYHMELADNPSSNYVYDSTNPATYTLMGKVYDECIALFKPRQFHIGHDEIWYNGTGPYKPAAQTIGKYNLILNDTKYWVNFLSARGLRTWAWADMFLGPGESPSARNAASVTEAQNYRAALPKDLVMINWDYSPTDPEDFVGLNILANAGFPTLSGTWDTPANITNFAKATADANAANSKTFGMVQTTWAGFNFDASSYANCRGQYEAYVAAAEQMWTGGTSDLTALDYPGIFARQMGEQLLTDQACGGFYIPISTPASAYQPSNIDVLPTNWQTAGLYLDRFIAPPPSNGEQPGVVMAGMFHKPDAQGQRGYTSLTIPVNNLKAVKLVFIGASTTSDATDIEVSRARVIFSDGTAATIQIRGGKETAGMQSVGGSISRQLVQTGGKNNAGLPVNYHAYVWPCVYPDKPITSITLTSYNNGPGYYLRAVSGLLNPPPAGVLDWSVF